MQAKLIVVGGDVKTTEVNLKLPCVIGRGRGTGLMLPHPLVSRQHCEIYEHEQQLVVRDMGSLNGTYINNTRLTEPTLLPSGDLLTVGTVTFRAEYAVDPNLAPPEGSAQTVRSGSAKTSPAPAKLPTPEEPDFTAFDEVEEVADVEVEEYSSGIVKDADALPAMSSSDDIDIMSMLEDEIEEVADETPPQPVVKKPAAPAKKIETPPDHGTKPTQAGNRWANPGAPAADLNETLREPAKKPDTKSGPGKPSASAATAPGKAEQEHSQSEDADDFLATLGIAAGAAHASQTIEALTTSDESANVATAAPEEIEDFVPEVEELSEPAESSLADTLLPSETSADEEAFVLEDIEMVEEAAELEAPDASASVSVETHDESLLSDLGLEESPAEPVAEDSLQAPLVPKFAEPSDADDLLSLEDSGAIEEVVEETQRTVEPAAEAWQPGSDGAPEASEPVASEPIVEELASIELLEEDDIAEPQLSVAAAFDPAAPPANDDSLLADLGLSNEEPLSALPGEPVSEDSFEAPSLLSFDDASESPIEVSEVESFDLDIREGIAEVDAVESQADALPTAPVSTEDAFLSELGLEESAPIESHLEPQPEHVADPPLPPAPEAVVDVPLATTSKDGDDFLADLNLDALPPLPFIPEPKAEDSTYEPLTPAPSEWVEEAALLDDSEVVEMELVEEVEEVAELPPSEPEPAWDQPSAEDSLLAPQTLFTPEAEQEPVAELTTSPPPVDADDFLAELGLDEVTPAVELPEAEAIQPRDEPLADAPLPEPLLSDSIAQADEVVEEVEIADIELVDAIDEQLDLAEPVAMQSLASDLEPVAVVEDPLPDVPPAVENAADFLADLGLDDPIIAIGEESEIEAVEEMVAFDSAPNEPEAIAPSVEALADFPAELAAVEEAAVPMFDAESAPVEFTPEAVDLVDVAGVEEVFDLDVEEVALDELEAATPASPPLPLAIPIAPLVDTSLVAGEFLPQSSEELAQTAETINSYDSALPVAQPLVSPAAGDLADDDFAAEMFGDTIEEGPADVETISDSELIAETEESVEVAADEVSALPIESEAEADFTSAAPVALATLAPRVMPAPLHVTKPYAYANPVARFPAARWTPPSDEGPFIQPARFPHAAPRPLHGPAVTSPAEVVAPLAALPLVAAPLADEILPEVPEISAEPAVAEWPASSDIAEVSETSEPSDVAEVTEITDVSDVEEFAGFAEVPEVSEVTDIEIADIEVADIDVTEVVESEPLPPQPEPEAVAEADEDLDAFLKDLEK